MKDNVAQAKSFKGFTPPSPHDFVPIREIRDYDASAISNRFEVGSQIELSDGGTYSLEGEEEVYLKYFTTGIISRITLADVFLEINGKICCVDKVRLLEDIVDPVLAEDIRANIDNRQATPKGSIRKTSIRVANPPVKIVGKELLGAYMLVDPRNEEIFYIGISKNMQRRYKQHLACCGLNYEKNTRIQEILQAGFLPRMGVIEEEIPRHKAKDQERYWIRHYRSLGAKLTNIAEMDEVE